MLPFFDLHCDTFLELYNKRQKIKDNTLHISLEKAKNFSPYVQIGAIWSDNYLTDDEAFIKCLLVIDYIKNQNINLVTNLHCLRKSNFILGIEDARLLNGNLSRLDTLYSLGVRILTLNWKGESIIGGGFDTSFPLTDFGKLVIKRCGNLGIIVDLSHSSVETFTDTINLATHFEFTPIASHSNSFSICSHRRNLTDAQFKELVNLKSLVGISFVPEHLGENASVYTIIQHINHFLDLGGENTIALGSDFDGVNNLPNGINSIDSLHMLHSALVNEFGEKITNKIFFENAYSYFKRIL